MEEPRPVAGRGAEAEREAILGKIVERDAAWGRPASPLEDPRWLPDLAKADGSAVLHIQMENGLRPFIQRRLARAYEVGLGVHIACPLSALYDDPLLAVLAPLHPTIHVVDDDREPERLLMLLAKEGIQVGTEARTALSSEGLALSGDSDASTHEKGRRFEAVCAFLFSQVDGFRVTRTNYRTDTEEIDLVIRQLSTQGRIWSREGPLILGEAKNHEAGISQQMFSAFRTKLEVKRGRVKLGFMVSRTTISGDAERQEAKTALGDIAIIFLDGDDLDEWAQAVDHDAWLERHIEAAILD